MFKLFQFSIVSRGYDRHFANLTSQGSRDGGNDYPHPPGGPTPRGFGPSGSGYVAGGYNMDDPSTRTNRGGFGNIHGNGMCLVFRNNKYPTWVVLAPFDIRPQYEPFYLIPAAVRP